MKLSAPMFFPFLGLLSGIVLSIFGLPLWFSFISGLSAVALYILISHISRNPIKAFRYNKFHFVWLFLVFFSIGILTVNINEPLKLENIDQYSTCKGNIVNISQKTSGDKATIDVIEIYDKDQKRISCDNLKILLQTEILDAQVGDILFFPINLKSIEDSENYFSNGYADSMSKKGIFYQSYVEEDQIKVYQNNGFSFNGTAWSIRDKLEAYVENTKLSKQTQNFLITILLGDRSYLNPEIRTSFADAGISHILALSGMHMAIIGGVIFWLLFPLNLIKKNKLRISVTLIFMFIYAYVTGLSASTIRATLMITAMSFGIILERKNSAWNSLLIAMFVILLFDPFAVMDIGLQLSFLCVVSLIFFARQLNPFKQHEHRFLHKFSGIIISTIIVTFSTWCVSAYYFGKIPLVFLPANIIVLPCLPIYLISALFYLLIYLLGLDFIFLRNMLDYVFNSIVSFIDFLTSGGDSAIIYTPTLLTVVLWSLVVTVLALWINNKSNKFHKWFSYLVIICFFISLPFSSNAEDEDSFIIQKGNRSISILTRINNKESIYKIENKTLTEFKIAGHKIIFIDNDIAINNDINNDIIYDELVIAGGCKNDLEEILEKYKTKKIIIHPSVKKKKESDYIDMAKELDMKIHSIRNDGAYRP